MNKHYLTTHYKLLFGSIWLSPLLFIIPLCILVYSVMPTTFWIVISSIFVIGEIFSATYIVYSEHLVLSEDGITYHSALSNIQSKWLDAETIKPGQWWFFKPEGFIVDNPETKMRNPLSSASRRLWGNSKRFIPLSCFASNWRDTELGHQIKQYAPHLFEKEKSVPSA